MAMSELKYFNLAKIILIIISFLLGVKSECAINLSNEMGIKAPLKLQFGDTVVPDGTSFLLPKMTSDIVSLYNQEEVIILCAGTDNRLNLTGTEANTNVAVAKCISGVNFLVKENSYALGDLQCTQEHQSAVREVGSCSGIQKRLQIGFNMHQNKFTRLIDVCFNDITYKTNYVNYTLVEGIARRQHINVITNSDNTDFYTGLSDSPDTYYSCSNQQSRLSSLLGSSNLGRQAIRCSSDVNYLVKTHLAPSSDFTYDAQKRASHYHINTVPMWYKFKNGNWKSLEEEIRQYASNVSREASDLIIYTGTSGVITLTNSRRTQSQICLGSNNGTDVVPVPQWVWKVVYEPNVKEGIVFILVNNPYQQRYMGCSCVCAQTKWTLAWNRTDRSKGYIYCCNVNQFRRIYTDLPQFEVQGLLKKDRLYTPFNLGVEAQ